MIIKVLFSPTAAGSDYRSGQDRLSLAPRLVWVDIGAEPLAAALREAAALSDEQRREMGVRGRRLVEEKYSWPTVTRRMISACEWLLSGGPKPDCVALP